MSYDQMSTQMTKQAGFIAALDQSGGSTPKALRGYGIDEDAYKSAYLLKEHQAADAKAKAKLER